MKAINIKLASFTFAAMLLASCSDSENGITTPDTTQDIVGKEVVSITDAQALAARVYNFKRPSATRAAGVTSANLNEAYTMKAEPTGLDFAKMDKMGKYESWNFPANTDMYIAPGETIASKNYNLNGNTIYVAGTYEYDPSWTAGNYTIIVLKGGTLKWKGGNIFPNQNGGKILCYGNFECNGDLDVQNRGILKIAGDLNLKGHSFKANNASVYIGGKLICNKFENEANAYTNIQGSIEGVEDQTIQVDGVVNVEGNFKTKDLYLIGNGQLYCCSLELTGEFKSLGGDGAGSALHTSYLKAKNLLLASSNNIYLVNNSSIEVEGTLQCNKNASAMIFLQGVNSKAYIKANVIKYNGKGSPASLMDCYMFNALDNGGEFYIDADHFDNSASNGGNLAFSDIQFLGSGKVHNFRNNSAPVTLVKAECGYTLNPDVPTPPHIDELGEILYDHTHDISATCIQEYNGKLYMSYHTRGKGHGGCIEVFETDANKQTKLLQYLQDKDNTMDFNHLMIDSKSSTPNLYVVGNYAYHNEAGKQTEANGLMARIGINSSGLLDTDVKNIGDAFVNPLIIVPLDQTTQSSSLDENAIIRDGDKLLITSTRGYEVYDPNTLELLNSKPTPGKAKHIAINGNEIAALYYTTRPSDPDAAVDAKLDLFDAGANIATATPKKTIDIASITPNNGKNTIAIDGENIYVCRSANGLTCYDKNGTEKWTWQAPLTASTKKPQGYANGVTYDNNYVYLACGGYGLVVLDKNEMEKGKPKVVAKTRVTGVADETTGKISWNSANYVKLYNGLIYVAYGKNRLKIYQLVDKNASGAGTSYETDKKQTKK